MAVRYIPYYPDPIEGQAILDNFTRTLKYHGSSDVKSKLTRGMPLYETQVVETVGKNKDGNLVIRGECVSACAYLKQKGIEVDLVYIDPPFASGANYAKTVYLRRNPKVATAIKTAEEELDIEDLKTFEEKMYGDIWDKEKYLNWFYENVLAMKSIMSENACIYVHLDWHIGHYVKVLLDEIFSEGNFINEITWHYYNKMAPKSKCFPRGSDKILVYAKNSNSYIFHTQYEKRAEVKKQLVRKFVNGKAINARDEAGNVLYQESSEKRIDDVWRIPMLQPADKEEPVDYATQKPEVLLERIISASSDKEMLVADFFGGSGVTASVANRLNRRFIHCDIGINSIQTTRDRLVGARAEFAVLEIKDGVSLFRNPVQTMDKLKSLIPGLKNDDSLESFWEGSISDSKLGVLPVYVPNLMDSSSKFLDKVLAFKIMHEAIPELPDSVRKVIVYYIDIDGLDEINKFIKDDIDNTVDIELRDLKQLLDSVIIEDNAEYTIRETNNGLMPVYEIIVNNFSSDRVNQKIDAYNQKGKINSILEKDDEENEDEGVELQSKKKKEFKPITFSETGLELIEYVSVDCSESKKEWHSEIEIKIDKFGYVIMNGVKTKDFWDGKIQSEKKPTRMKIRNICGDETIWIIN